MHLIATNDPAATPIRNVLKPSASHLGAGMKIVQCTKTRYEWSQRWQGSMGSAAFSVVIFTMQFVVMDLRVEGSGYFSSIAAEIYKQTARRDVIHREALLREPSRQGSYICFGRAVLLAKLRWGQPLMVMDGVCVIELAIVGVQGLLAAIASSQHEQDVVQRKSVGYTTGILRHGRVRGRVAGEPLILLIADLRGGSHREEGYRCADS